jgi:hypothetical protein
MIRTFTAILLPMVIAGACSAASFDLTSSVHDYGTSELAIDLGQAFARIDGVCLRFEGHYTPGVLLGAQVTPPRTYTADDFHFLIRLDNPDTSWLDKSVYAHADMHGLAGAVGFALPLFDSHPPSFFPRSMAPPNYDFLLDGQFGMSVTSLLITLPEEQLIERPIFNLTRLSLEIDGVASPEPGLLAVAWPLFFAALKR